MTNASSTQSSFRADQPSSVQPSPDVLSFSRVAMRYGRGQEVLRDINLSLPHSSMSFLTGASGAGKSSLLKLIYMQQRPSRGLITLFDRDTALIKGDLVPHYRRRIGLVLQDFALINHISLFENVALPLRVSGVKHKDYQADVAELLNWVGLGQRMHALPPTLSGGEKQRAAIARAVIAKPDLLLADEPTANVDPEMGARLIKLFGEMNRLGTTILIATHDLNLIPAGHARLHLENGVIHRHKLAATPAMSASLKASAPLSSTFSPTSIAEEK